jgi:hypothetical protein
VVRTTARASRHALELTLANGDEEEDTIRLEASQREEEGEDRRPVGPLGVVDDDRHRAAVLDAAQQLDERRPDGERIGAAPGRLPEGGEWLRQREADRVRQLLDHAEGHELLLVGAAGPEDLHVARLGEHTAQDRGLADPGRALDEDEPGLAGPNLVQLRPKPAQLLLPADERPGQRATSRHPSRTLTHVKPSGAKATTAGDRPEKRRPACSESVTSVICPRRGSRSAAR